MTLAVVFMVTGFYYLNMPHTEIYPMIMMMVMMK